MAMELKALDSVLEPIVKEWWEWEPWKFWPAGTEQDKLKGWTEEAKASKKRKSPEHAVPSDSSGAS